MKYPTRILRSETLTDGEVTSLLVTAYIFSTAPCQLVGVAGYNNTANDIWIQIFGSADVSEGDFAICSCKAFANSDYSWALPAPIGLDALTIVASSTLDGYTAIAGTPVTIQALLAA